MGLAGVDSPGLGRAGLGGRGSNKEEQDSGQGQGGIHQAGAAFRGLRASRPSPPPEAGLCPPSSGAPICSGSSPSAPWTTPQGQDPVWCPPDRG